MTGSLWTFGIIALWGVVFANLLLTLRLVRWFRGLEDQARREAEMADRPELPVGSPAPDLRTKTLSGEPFRLSDYAGRAVVLIFVSPYCESCRQEMPILTRLGARAKERSGVELILVSDAGTTETYSWVHAIRNEDKVDINLTVLVTPRHAYDFLLIYNPRRMTPYFCFVNEQGVVRARDPLGDGEWPKLKREWEGLSETKRPSRALRQYR